jgi:hypothetical protein
MRKPPRPPPARPGYEPAQGRPDPSYQPPPTPAAGYYTHMPHPSGTVCGVFPTPSNAAHYDPIAPTCPICADWLAAVQRMTAARYGRYEAQAAAKDAADAAPAAEPPGDSAPTDPPAAPTRPDLR